MHYGATLPPPLLDGRGRVLLTRSQQHTSSKHPCLVFTGALRRSKAALNTYGASLLASPQVTVSSSSTPQHNKDLGQIRIKRKARAARMAGQVQLALRVLLDGLQQYPQDCHLIGAAASAAAKLGDASQAFQILSPALQAQPHNVHLLTAAAQAHLSSGNVAAARQCLQTAAATQPNNAVILQCWGVLEASCGNLETAINLYKQSVAVDGYHVPTYVAWARLQAERGRVREARSLHQQGHQADPQHAPNLHAWAELESSEGQWLLAIKLLQAALKADRNHLPSWMALSKAHWAIGDSASARRVCQAACRSLGPVPQLLNQWATLEQQAQRIPAARAVLRFTDQALQPQPQYTQQPQQQEQQSSLQQLGELPAGRRRRTRCREQQQAVDGDEALATQYTYLQQQQQQQQQQQDSLLQVANNAEAQQQDGSLLDALPGSIGRSASLLTTQLPQLLEYQLEQLEAFLNVQGCSGRAVVPAVAAPSHSLVDSCPPAPAADDSSSSSSGETETFSNNTGGCSSSSSSSSQPSLQQQQVQPPLQQQQQHPQQAAVPNRSSMASTGPNSATTVSQSIPAAPIGLTQHIPALVSAAVMEHRAGNTSKALKLYQTALEAAPGNPKLLHALAQLHLKRGDRSAADVQLQQLEQHDPCNGFLCHTRGVLAQQEGHLGEAREWFVKGLKAQGCKAALLNYEALAELQVFMGDASGARATLAAGLNSRRPTARFLRMAGLVEKRLGNVDSAAKLLARAVARAPRDYRSWLAWAVLERRRGDFAAAARCFMRGTACAPCNPHIWYAWAAMTWRDCSDHLAARRLYEQATAFCPRNAPLWMEWAMLEWDKAGNLKRARQLFAAGADVPPSYQHPPLYQAWAQREIEAGNEDAAQRLTARSFEVATSLKRVKK